MGKPYPAELRAKVVDAVLKDGASPDVVARTSGVAVSTVRNWVRSYRNNGQVAPKAIGGRKPCAIRGASRDWVIARVTQKDYTIRGLVSELENKFQLVISPQTVRNFLIKECLRARRFRSGADHRKYRADGRMDDLSSP